MLTKSGSYWYDDLAVRDGGHNLWDYWLINTQPTPEAHFATFGDDIPQKAILASCPREVCQACGKARDRVVERGFTAHDGATESAYAEGTSANRLALLRQAARANGGEYVNDSQALGWTDCRHDKYAPGLVLDPFAGTGTTGVVALRLGRSFVGIELSTAYAEMARTKLSLWWKDERARIVPRATQETLL